VVLGVFFELWAVGLEWDFGTIMCIGE
jgi:hypothetical protein